MGDIRVSREHERVRDEEWRRGKSIGLGPTVEWREERCLSTRTPHRPRPVGLSVGKIISVDWERGEVTLGGIDLVDGTPVLDIKPYVPWCDSVTEATAPKWVTRAIEGEEGEPLAIREVKFAAPEDGTREKVRKAYMERFEIDSKKGGKKQRPLYENADDFVAFVMDTLRLDVRGTREGRRKRRRGNLIRSGDFMPRGGGVRDW